MPETGIIELTCFSPSCFVHTCVLRLLLNNLPPGTGRAVHFLLMIEEYLKGKRNRIAPTYHAAITQLSGVRSAPVGTRVKASAGGTCSLSTVVSLHPLRGGTGESNLTAHLASRLVQWGKRIAMVATDIQSPGIHALFRS